ncbi:MAG: uridine kinase [Cyanobacteria bacterium]|nr:uridine kinase [Cyanobacteriota bacterium]
MSERHPQVIAICGGSGSGKSTLASKFIGASVIATDHFYKDLDQLTPQEDGSYDFDHPSSVDLDACASACLTLKTGSDVIIPVYDMRTYMRTGTQVIPAPANQIVVVEGIFAFHSPLQEIATLKIFIDTPIDQRMARRLRRDVERGRSTRETIAHSLQVEEAYERFIDPMKSFADLILMGEEMRGNIGY